MRVLSSPSRPCPDRQRAHACVPFPRNPPSGDHKCLLKGQPAASTVPGMSEHRRSE
jgi:hypothetical protein